MGENVFLVSGHVANMTSPGVPLTAVSAGATGTGPWVPKGSPDAAVQVFIQGTGAVTATVVVEVSNGEPTQGSVLNANNPATPVACDTPAATITLSGTNIDSDGFTTQNSPWKWMRLRVTAITGTGASITGLLGI